MTGFIKITYDEESDMAYIYLPFPDNQINSEAISTVAYDNFNLDFYEGKVVGIEIFQAKLNLNLKSIWQNLNL